VLLEISFHQRIVFAIQYCYTTPTSHLLPSSTLQDIYTENRKKEIPLALRYLAFLILRHRNKILVVISNVLEVTH
jgi:hypothetical protein